MPRMKRNPLIYLLVAVIGLYFLYSLTTSNDNDMPFRASTESRLTQSPDRKTETSNFRQTTPEEIAHSIKGQGGHAVHPDVEKEKMVKGLTSEKQPAAVSDLASGKVEGTEIEEQSVAGRKMMPKPKEKPKYPVTGEDKAKFIIGEEPARNGGKPESATDLATLDAKAELDDILKRSPIIIFSKSYCPHSSDAKRLLQKTYRITPAPHVVELDQLTTPLRISSDPENTETITLGRKIQDLLAEWTSRKTVPNILVNARSIGGASDIIAMDDEGKLVDEIKLLGMGKVKEMVRSGDQ